MNKIEKKHFIFSIIIGIALLPIGILMFIYAGIDDSPGGQLLGLLVTLGGIIKLVLESKNIFLKK